jgi:hypothetical protein
MIARGIQDGPHARQHLSQRSADIQAAKDGQALLTQGAGEVKMPLLVGRDRKVVQGESLTQGLPQLPEDGQALFASDAYVGRVTQFSRDVAEGQQRAGPAGIPHGQVEVEGFLGEGGRPR